MSIPSFDLPSPDLVLNESFETILQRMKQIFNANVPADFQFSDSGDPSDADPSALLMQAASYEFKKIREDLNTAYRQLLIAYATGANLDNLVAQWGVTRQTGEDDATLRRRGLLIWHSLSASGTEGYYTYHLLNADMGVKNLIAKRLYAGWVNLYIQMQEGVTNNTVSQAVETVTRGADNAQVATRGQWSLTSATEIDIYPNTGDPTTHLTNHWEMGSQIQIGTAVYTLIDAVRIESGHFKATVTATGTPPAVAATGALSVIGIDNAPKVVSTLITNSSETGISDYLTNQQRRVLNDTLKVQSVTTKPYKIAATITPEPTADGAIVLAAVKAKLATFIIENEVIGRDLPLSVFYAAMQSDGVNQITLTKPTATVVTSSDTVTPSNTDFAIVPVYARDAETEDFENVRLA